MILFEKLTIKTMWLVVACLLFLAASDIGAQAVQSAGESDNAAATLANEQITDTSGNVETPENTAPEGQQTPAKTGKSEVEYNEDNYRRFMELRDQDPRNSTLPTNTFKPGTQKLDELPEESQKHLRNELRSIIVQEGEWQEGDENNEYAYVPSEAGKGNSELQNLEAAAWEELVDEYQEREAQIHANSARSEAARQAGSAAGNTPSSQSGQQGSNGSAGQQGQTQQNGGSQGDGSQGGQSGQAGQSGQSGAQNQQQSESEDPSSSSDDSYSPTEAATKATERNQGVSENALQFLMQAQQKGQQQGSGGGPLQQSSGNETGPQAQEKPDQQSGQQAGQESAGGQADQPAGDASSAQQANPQSGSASAGAQTADSAQAAETSSEKASRAAVSQEDQSDAVPPSILENEETGTTENAFEQLRGDAQQDESQQNDSQQDNSQQDDKLQDSVQQEAVPADTLLIRDLINAQGVVIEAPGQPTNRNQESPDVQQADEEPDSE